MDFVHESFCIRYSCGQFLDSKYIHIFIQKYLCIRIYFDICSGNSCYSEYIWIFIRSILRHPNIQGYCCGPIGCPDEGQGSADDQFLMCPNGVLFIPIQVQLSVVGIPYGILFPIPQFWLNDNPSIRMSAIIRKHSVNLTAGFELVSLFQTYKVKMILHVSLMELHSMGR